MADNKIGVSFTADTTGLMTGVSQAVGAVQSGVGQMQGAFGGLGNVIGQIKGPFMAFTAILGGGAIFKSTVDATVKWNGEAIKLARSLGITTEEASVLNLALGDIYTDMGTYTGAVNKLTMQIATGGEGFKKLGINVKDSSGNLKPSVQIMNETLAALNKLEAGTNRNAAGVAIFGRSWGETQKLLKLNAGVMEEARLKAERLSLIVGEDSVEANKKYKAAMNDVEDVMMGVQIAVGKELLPALSDLGQWFADIAPGVIPVVSFLIKILVQAFYDLGLGIKVVWNLLVAIWKTGEQVANALSRAFTALVNGDWDALTNSFKGVGDGIAKVWNETLDKLYDDSVATNEKINKLWADKPPTKGKKMDKATDTFDPDKGEKGNEKWLKAQKQMYESAKNLDTNWFTWSSANDLAFWNERLKKAKALGGAAYTTVLAEINKARKEQKKEELEGEKNTFDLEMTRAKEDTAKRVMLAFEESERIKAVYGAKSKEYTASLRRVEEEEQRHNEKMKELHKIEADAFMERQLAMVDFQEELMLQASDAGVISKKKEIQALMEFEQRKYQIKLDAAKSAAALEPDPNKKAEINARIEQIEAQHGKKLLDLNGKLTANMRAQFTDVFMGLTSGFSSAIQGLVKGTMTWADALHAVLDSALNWIINFFVQWGLQAAANYLALQIFGAASRTAEATGAAAVYAVNAMSSVAAIPMIGWAMAPGVGAAAYGAGLAMAGLSSAAGGWGEVPHDQIAQIHKKEMILPAQLAEGVRGMIAGGGPKGSGDTFIIQAADAKSFMDMYKRSGPEIIKHTKEMTRNRRTN